MAEGGFLVKFDEKEPQRAYAVKFDYDEWSYAINSEEKEEMPKGVQRITIEIERGAGDAPCLPAGRRKRDRA